MGIHSTWRCYYLSLKPEISPHILLVDDIDTSDVQDPTGQLSQITQVSLEFYEGFLLALDTLKKMGISVNLNVFDTKRSQHEVSKILDSKSIEVSELMVGPFIFDEIKPVAQFAAKNNIKLCFTNI